MLKALRTSVILLALVGTAHAGDIFTPPVSPPPAIVEPPPPMDSSTYDTPDVLAEIAQGLLAILPSLL